jgi:hypothetical protein
MNNDFSPAIFTFKISSNSKLFCYIIGIPFLLFGFFILIHGIVFTFYYSNPQVLIFSLPFGFSLILTGSLIVLIPIKTKISVFQEKLVSSMVFKKKIFYFKDIKVVDFQELTMPYVSDRLIKLHLENGDQKNLRLSLYSSDTCNEIIDLLKQSH